MSKTIDGSLPISEEKHGFFYNAKPFFSAGAVYTTGSIFGMVASKCCKKDIKSYDPETIAYCNEYTDKTLARLNNGETKNKYKIIDMSTSMDSSQKMFARSIGKKGYLQILKETEFFEKSILKTSSRDITNYNLHLAVLDQVIHKPGILGLTFNRITTTAKGQNAVASYTYNKVFVNRKKDVSACFHELGHLKIGSALNITGKISSILLPICLFYAISKKSNNINEDKKDFGDFIKKHCVGLTILTQIPRLLDEGLASILGIKLAKNAGMHDKNMLNKIKISYSKGYMTYLLSALTIIGSVYTASKVKDSM